MRFALLGDTAASSNDELAAAETLAHEIIGEAFERESHPPCRERSKRLAGGAVQIEGKLRAFAARVVRSVLSHFAGQSCAQRAIFIGDAGCEREWHPGFVRGQRRSNPGVVERRVRFGTVVALPLPTKSAAGFCCDGSRGEHWLEVEPGIKAHLLKKIGAANGVLERR